jgi:hypothetical protein
MLGQYKNKSGDLGIAIENLCRLSIIVCILKKKGKGVNASKLNLFIIDGLG